MLARVLAVLILIASTGATLAAPPTAADAKAVAQCLDAARKGDGFGGNCVGVVADPCIKAASGRDSDVANWKACAARELAVWQARLTQAVMAVSKNGGSQMRKAVAAAQKTWANSQDAFCPLFANLDPGMTPGADTYCRLQETAWRALMLERLSAAVDEH